jgi:Ca-activated chloride channel family protein
MVGPRTKTIALVALVAWSQVYKTGTHVVPIYATVTDARGQLVRDLTAADFEIQDNGARQTVSMFTNDVQRVTVAILLDESPSLFPAASRTTAAVTEFTTRLLPDDRACIGMFGHTVTLDPQLTGNPQTLLARLNGPKTWPAGTALWDAIDAGRAALAAEGGRRVVLVVSDGADNASRVDPNDVRIRLQREGVLVYAIGVRGRFGLETSELGALASASGGRGIELRGSDDLPAVMAAIADELHHQYVIGFSPASLDGRLHRLEVKIKRPGLTVRARRMYLAANSEAR